MSWVKSILLGLSISLMFAAVAQADAVQKYYDEMRKFFEGTHWLPLIIPRDEQIGNVYNIRTFQFVADGKTCFPKLTIPALKSTVLPSRTLGSNINGALAVGVKDVAAAEAQLGVSDAVTFQLLEPQVMAVPAMTLVNLYDSQRCKFLEKQVEATRTGAALASDTAHLVLGEILFAKRNILFTYKDNAKASAEVSNWQRLFRVFGLNASASIAAQSDNSVAVLTPSSLPVAVRPAFVPDKFPDAQIGFDPQKAAVNWAPLNIEDASQQQHLDELTSKFGDNLPSSAQMKDF